MRLRHAIFSALAFLLLPCAAAQAAPQILALLATDSPVPLDCRDGQCTALLTAICLQKDRVPPAPETAYGPIGIAQNLKLVVTGSDGRAREVAGKDEMTIVSQRNFLSVRVTVPQETMARLGATALAVSVGKGVSLLAAPIPNDPNPQTEKEIARTTDTLRNEAAWLDDPNDAYSSQARIANRVLSMLPTHGAVESAEARRAFDQVARANAGKPGMKEFGALYKKCEDTQGWSIYGRNMRECVESWHDSLMMERNVEYWERTGAGS
ncbi:MAG: hypothetical protein NTY59_16510 [Alphaproteobacteria bacterium]|nr:hypothetical protein [Alphaproteobacteria bacterium]